MRKKTVPIGDCVGHWYGQSIALMLVMLGFQAMGAEETWNHGDVQVLIGGQFEHGQTPEDVPIKEVDSKMAAVFQNDIFGPQFTLTVAHLAAGKYQVSIGEAETYFNEPDQRRFDVDCNGTLIATNVDIFRVAGEFGKVCHITSEVNHPDDAAAGPLVITFIGRKQNAKFNTLDIKDETGKSIVVLDASQFEDAEVAGAAAIPIIDSAEVWKDSRQPVDVRVTDLVRRLSLAEKARQLELYDGGAVLNDNQRGELGRAKADAVFDVRRGKRQLQISYLTI